jgi:geranylgeranyl diphosphate synthase type I
MTWIVELKARIDARLASYLEQKQAAARQIDPQCEPLVAAISALTMRGGKRLRPAVLAAAYAAVTDDSDLSKTIDAGASLELLQSYLLIHDDWMDEDVERRGGPTVHVAMRAHTSNVHIADSLGILAGDLASVYAWELLHGAPFGERTDRAMRAFISLQEDVVIGQHLDVLGCKNIVLVERLKTGSYTVRGPLRLGAILGDANEAQLAALDHFAEPMGRAFQMRDDLLGTFGNPSKTGKSSRSDLRAGKTTVLVTEALQSTKPSDRVALDAVLGRKDATDVEVDAARDFLDQSGVRARVESALDVEIEKAKDVLVQSGFARIGHDRLYELVSMLATRDA